MRGGRLRSGGRGVVGLALVVLVGVGACVTDDRYLPALLEDPIAHLELPGTQLVRRLDTPQNDRAWVQASHASIQQIFWILDPGEADAVLAEAVVYAESVGWVFDELLPHQSVLVAYKELDSGVGRVGLSLYEEEAQIRLSVRLDFAERFP